MESGCSVRVAGWTRTADYSTSRRFVSVAWKRVRKNVGPRPTNGTSGSDGVKLKHPMGSLKRKRVRACARARVQCRRTKGEGEQTAARWNPSVQSEQLEAPRRPRAPGCPRVDCVHPVFAFSWVHTHTRVSSHQPQVFPTFGVFPRRGSALSGALRGNRNTIKPGLLAKYEPIPVVVYLCNDCCGICVYAAVKRVTVRERSSYGLGAVCVPLSFLIRNAELKGIM